MIDKIKFTGYEFSSDSKWALKVSYQNNLYDYFCRMIL